MKESTVTVPKLDDRIQMRDVGAILSFLPRFGELDPIQACVRWPGIRIMQDRLIIARAKNHPLVLEFLEALYTHGLVRDYDWPGWRSRAVRYFQDPKILQKATLKTCIKLLTLHARMEHFVDGHFGMMVRDGHIQAILRRLSRLCRAD
jgi:Family of unknown function (DUF6508)